MGEVSWLDLYLELAALYDEGIELYIGDTRSTPSEISDACCVKERSYMRDYIMNEEGDISEIRFYRIE